MSVRVRLTRVGSKKNPIWRVVVADQRSPRDGRFIETVGQYNPQTEPSTIVIDEERLQHWLDRGAQPTGTVKKLIKAHAKGATPGAATDGGASRDEAPAMLDASAPPEATEPAGAGAEADPSEPATYSGAETEAGGPLPASESEMPDARAGE